MEKLYISYILIGILIILVIIFALYINKKVNKFISSYVELKEEKNIPDKKPDIRRVDFPDGSMAWYDKDDKLINSTN